MCFPGSFLTIWIHGTLEISAIIIAGAAGLVAGSGLSFSRHLLQGAGLPDFDAAWHEDFLRCRAGHSAGRRFRKLSHAVYRYARCDPRGIYFVLARLCAVVFRLAAPAQGCLGDFAAPVGDKELPPTREHAVDFNAIKNAGEILSDTFTVVSRHPKTAWLGLTGLSLAYVTITYGLSGTGTGIADTFHFDMAEGVMSGVYGLFAGYRFFVQLALLAVFAVAALLAVNEETGVVAHTAKKALYVALGILLPVAGIGGSFLCGAGTVGVAGGHVCLSIPFPLGCGYLFRNGEPVGGLITQFYIDALGAGDVARFFDGECRAVVVPLPGYADLADCNDIFQLDGAAGRAQYCRLLPIAQYCQQGWRCILSSC